MVHVELDRQAYAHDLEEHLQRTLFSGGIADPEGAILLIRGALASGDQAKAATLAAETQRLAAGQPSDTEMAAGAEHARGLVEQNPHILDRAAERYSTERARACALEDAGNAWADRGCHDNAEARLRQAHGTDEPAGALAG